MKVLQKTLLARVAGGETEEVLLYSGGGGDGGFGGDWWANDWGGAGGYGGSDFSGGNFTLGQFGSVSGNFDSNGIGAQSCAPQAASGLFGLSMTETIGAGTAMGALATAIGQGVGASFAIEAAGGLGAVGGMGAGAAGLMGSAALGLGGALLTGGVIGTLAYEHSETVRDVAQAAIGGVFEIIEGTKQLGAAAFGIERVPQPVYHP